MKRLRIETIIPVAFLLFAAFVLGFLAPDVSANGADAGKWLMSLQRLPQRIEFINNRAPEAKVKPLPLVDTYSAVMERLKTDYYSPSGEKIDERELTYDAIRGMLVALDDPFTKFLDPDEYKEMREDNEGEFAGIGALLDTNDDGNVYVKEPLPNTPAEAAGVKAYDVIIAVDDRPVGDMLIEDVVKIIRGPVGSKVKLTLQRPNVQKPLDIVIKRAMVNPAVVVSSVVDEKSKIGYLRLYKFNEKADVQFDEALAKLEKENIKGLVLDLRSNPGGLLQMAIDITSRFVESGPVVTIQERGGQKTPYYVREDKHNHKRYPLAVLVDQRSASASEILSGAIKDTGVGTLVGKTTFGKGRVQTIIPLQDGSAAAIVTAKYLTPKGTDIHKKGIDPDIVVEEPETYEPGDPKTDVQLARAIDVVKVKLGLLPQSKLEEMKKTAKAEVKDKAESETQKAEVKVKK